MFSTLQPGSTVYVLCREERPKLYVAKVTERTEPVPNMNAPRPMYGQPLPNVVKVVAEADGNTFIFNEVDANSKLFVSKQNAIISTTKEDMAAEWDRITAISRQALDSMAYHQGILDADDGIRAMLNPQFAKEQEREMKMGVLETKMTGIEQALSSIQTMLSSLGAKQDTRKKASNDND